MQATELLDPSAVKEAALRLTEVFSKSAFCFALTAND
jgi:hypothetical protein